MALTTVGLSERELCTGKASRASISSSLQDGVLLP